MPPAKLLFHNDLAAEFQTNLPLPDECFMCNILSKEPPALQAIINPLSPNQCMPQWKIHFIETAMVNYNYCVIYKMKPLNVLLSFISIIQTSHFQNNNLTMTLLSKCISWNDLFFTSFNFSIWEPNFVFLSYLFVLRNVWLKIHSIGLPPATCTANNFIKQIFSAWGKIKIKVSFSFSVKNAKNYMCNSNLPKCALLVNL